MPHIHPSAILDGDIQLADDVVVGPACILTGTIRIGPGSTLVSSVHLNGPLWMGARNVCYPGTCLGFAPQDRSYQPSTEGAGVVIGSGNIFREHVTIHRATKDRPTTIGDDNYWMVNSHAGHDCVVGNGNTFANGTALAGHVHLADRVVIGGSTMVHQFVRVGRNAMLSGGSGTSSDVPPFCILSGVNQVGGLNIIGMRRGGFPRATIDAIRWAFRTLYAAGSSPKQNAKRLLERGDVPEVRELHDFVVSGKRPIIDRVGRVRHALLALRRGDESESDDASGLE